jgi:hypothetical protein
MGKRQNTMLKVSSKHSTIAKNVPFLSQVKDLKFQNFHLMRIKLFRTRFRINNVEGSIRSNSKSKPEINREDIK